MKKKNKNQTEERYVSHYERRITDGSLKTRDEIVEFLGTKMLGIETLETRNSDRLDFHEVAVWSLKEALELAYLAGQRTALIPIGSQPLRGGRL